MSYPNVSTHAVSGMQTSLNVTASGVLKAAPGKLGRVIINTVTAVNAITLNDCLTVAAAAAGNTVLTIPSGAAVGTTYTVDWVMNTGIVVSFGASGTGALAISYE